MANKTARVSISASYSDPDDQAASIARANISAPYTAQAHTEVDIVAGTLTNQVYAIDFGSIGDEATFIIVKNLTANADMPAGQDLILKINGSASLMHIPPGGAVCFANPGATETLPLVSMSLTTTDTQAGLGRISAHVFGDPEEV